MGAAIGANNYKIFGNFKFIYQDTCSTFILKETTVYTRV
jgi:hypothetical protein